MIYSYCHEQNNFNKIIEGFRSYILIFKLSEYFSTILIPSIWLKRSDVSHWKIYPRMSMATKQSRAIMIWTWILIISIELTMSSTELCLSGEKWYIYKVIRKERYKKKMNETNWIELFLYSNMWVLNL